MTTAWWLDYRDGIQYCRVCHVAATAEHLASEKHRREVLWHPENLSGGGVQATPSSGNVPPLHWGNPDFFAWTDSACGAGWRCVLCNQWAEEAHVTGQKHTKKAKAHAELYKLQGADALACSDVDPFSSDSGAGSLGQAKRYGTAPLGQRQVSAREPWWSGEDGAAPSAASCAEEGGLWRRQWSSEHDCYYFYHVRTRDTRWTAPPGVQLTPSRYQRRVPSAASSATTSAPVPVSCALPVAVGVDALSGEPISQPSLGGARGCPQSSQAGAAVRMSASAWLGANPDDACVDATSYVGYPEAKSPPRDLHSVVSATARRPPKAAPKAPPAGYQSVVFAAPKAFLSEV